MRDILRKAKPQRLDDLIALNALYRPGPLRSGMVDDFIARKQGKTEVKYELPQLEPILRGHLRRHRLSGTGDAHLERRSPASRSARPTCCARRWARRTPRSWRSSAASSSRARRSTGINEKKAAHIFDLMEHFAGYGFNKSHSTAYAFLAYQTAYLKANYPWHFAAALLTIEAQNTDKLALYLGECRERGIPVLPPDINESQLRFTVEPDGRALRPDGDQERRRRRDRVAARGPRAKQGRITSLHALCEDLDLRLVNKRVFESLVEGRRVRLAGAAAIRRRGAAVGGAAAAAARRRSTPRASTARGSSATASEGQAQLFGGFDEDDGRGSGAGRAIGAARGAAVDRDRAARLREGDARPVLERPSGRSLRERAEGVRRALDRRAGRSRRRAAARRRAGAPAGRKPIEPDTSVGGIVAAVPPAEDAQGRSHGGLHARGRAGRRRGHRVSGDVPARAPA